MKIILPIIINLFICWRKNCDYWRDYNLRSSVLPLYRLLLLYLSSSIISRWPGSDKFMNSFAICTASRIIFRHHFFHGYSNIRDFFRVTTYLMAATLCAVPYKLYRHIQQLFIILLNCNKLIN